MTTKTSVFATNDVVTANDLNAEAGAWNSWTPTLTQSGTVAKTTVYAKYLQYGKKVRGQIRLTVSGSGTGSNAIYFSLPVTAQSSILLCIGSGIVWDNSASTHYQGAVQLASTTTAGFIVSGSTAYLGVSGLALASGDEIRADFEYEAA